MPGDFKAWADESNKIARDVVYADFSDPMTQLYIDYGLSIIKQRLVLGGERLA